MNMKWLYSAKYRHYKKRSKITRANIWDLEFLRYQLQQQREGVRLEYDRLREQMDACDQKTTQENLKPNPDKSVIDSLARLKASSQTDLEQFKAQMDSIDQQIDGDQGINSKISGARSLSEMIKSFNV